MLKVQSERHLITEETVLKSSLRTFAWNAMADIKANFNHTFTNNPGATVKNQALTKKLALDVGLSPDLIIKFLTELFNECDPFLNEPELEDLWKQGDGKFNVSWTERMIASSITISEYKSPPSSDPKIRYAEVCLVLSELTAICAVMHQLRTVLTWEPSAENRDRINLNPVYSRLTETRFMEKSTWFDTRTVNLIRNFTDDILERRGFEIDTYKFHKQFVVIKLFPFVSPTSNP